MVIPDRLKDTSTVFHLSKLSRYIRQNFDIVNCSIGGRIQVVVKIIENTFSSTDIETLANSAKKCITPPFAPSKVHP